MKKIIFHHFCVLKWKHFQYESQKTLYAPFLPLVWDCARSLKYQGTGHLGGSVVERLPLAQGMILGCHLSSTVSEGNGPWCAQHPASPSDTALTSSQGLLEWKAAGFVPATGKVVQKEYFGPDRTRDVIIGISCLEFLSCIPLDFSFYCKTFYTESFVSMKFPPRVPFYP
ncbi:unnamed protein product [Nyctereutes procyonoides]|uniref:(raccoon dog) hypothetical protein n=1 Tax=Nyctereutes procyonoides TaxID=34880 RepID=A0A811YGV9_NYCPR|nr:unnamed protein product [Nyctereutes procyonoides]